MMKMTWMKHNYFINAIGRHSNGWCALIQNGHLRLGVREVLLALTVLVSLFFIALMIGYKIASSRMGDLDRLLNKTYAAQHLVILNQHVGRIEANLMRLNALGEKLVESASLDPEEFNFNEEVGVGGTIDRGSLSALEAALERRYTKFQTLDQILQHQLEQSELSFSGEGKVVAKGWISSFFGYRRDPFTGHKRFHSGVDIAGKEGTEIKALASGIVSYANKKGKYGHLIEIRHPNGLSTRYGHAKTIVVKPGQLVHKGETVALLGSTGRSTGPHVHVEVRKEGKAVDPGLYFPDLKRRSA